MENQSAQVKNFGVPNAPVASVQPVTSPPPQPIPNQQQKSPLSKLKFIIIIFIVLIMIGAIVGFIFLKKPFQDSTSLAAKVGDTKITLEQVNTFARECKIDQKEATEYLVDEIVLTNWAGDEKVEISQEEQKADECRMDFFHG